MDSLNKTMDKNAKAIVMMDDLLSRMKPSIVASVGEIKRNPKFWGFELTSDCGERISVIITPGFDMLEIFFKDESICPEEDELPAILLQMKNGTYKPRPR